MFFDGDSLKCTVEFKEQKVDFKDRSNGNYPNLLQLYKGWIYQSWNSQAGNLIPNKTPQLEGQAIEEILPQTNRSHFIGRGWCVKTNGTDGDILHFVNELRNTEFRYWFKFQTANENYPHCNPILDDKALMQITLREGPVNV